MPRRWWERAATGAAVVLALLMAAPVPRAPAQSRWQAEWDKALAAARQEGRVVVSGPPGVAQREIMVSAWARTFPGITLDYTPARGTQVLSKVVRERAAGLYNWDAVLASTDPTVFVLVPIHALAPLRSAFIDPSLGEDKTWIGGFAAGFVDAPKQYFYSVTGEYNPSLGYVNRDCVSEATFHGADDLTKPGLRGKVVWYDPTLPGSGSRSTYLLTRYKGEDWLKDVLKNHGIVFSRDYHQMADWLVSCTKPIAIGLGPDVLPGMQQSGVGKHVKQLLGASYFGEGPPTWTGANEDIGWYAHAPHPNAARIFVNWYMSRAFQQEYATRYQTDSRRTDVKPGDPDLSHALKPGVTYQSISDEATLLKIKALEDRIKSWNIFG